MRICLNAALLAGSQNDYRAAGISQYQSQSLSALAAIFPNNWQLEAWVSAEILPEAYPGIPLRHAPWSLRRPASRILWEQLILPAALRHADLFHGMAFVSPAFLRCPLVLTLYDLSFYREPEHLPAARRHYLSRATRWSARRARRILTISAAVAADIVDHLAVPRERIDIAPPGVDRSRFYPRPAEEVAAFRRQKALPERYWLCVSTLEPRKNLVTLLAAYAQLKPAHRVPLFLAGGAGWGTAEIHSCIERWQLRDSVFLPGFLPAEELPLWYNGADWFLFPSVHEGFGMPVLEAMACGVPTLTSDASALRELLGDSEHCIPSRDADAWREALQRVALGEMPRQSIREHSLLRAAQYTWENTAKQILATYRAALA